MNTATRLGVYGLGLAVAFAGAFGAGRLADPLLPAAADGAADAGGGHAHDDTAPAPAGAPVPAGLQVAADGYRLETLAAPGAADEEGDLSFRVIGPGGDPVTGFEVAHEKRMHLIVVGRDLTGYQHLHPRMDGDGVWTVRTTLDDPGPYRMYADFVPMGGGDGLVLGTDLAVPGAYRPADPPPVSATAEVDGYEVELSGALEPGATGDLTFTVRRDGAEVTDLEPYLGAYGHLVALREDDLAYLHVHPEGAPGDGATAPGPDIAFRAEVPSAGGYRLYLDFQHGGEVRTAVFAVDADGGAAPPAEDGGAPEEHGH
ncbi:hypothetical protein [Nocardiopsis trehalosi]|uniref:hypothetical protein n=1 Tax=Nocardiopsis trehalosi TaxID=109329 RepID=UPI0008298EB3|nr:hypothetical protein [Nocardiopsis trehalosi]